MTGLDYYEYLGRLHFNVFAYYTLSTFQRVGWVGRVGGRMYFKLVLQ